ncbi:hypothetical protein DDE05_04830, partial [Streptomyces cavourensis]
MAAPDPHQAADPEAVKRHPALFRAIRKRKNPRLRRTDITVTDDAAVKRAVKAASLGNAMEWFDFGIYSYLAVTIGHVFFPSGNDTTQLLSSFATFAVAFLVRPLGGMFFGPMGDKIGRKKLLVISLLMMGGATFAMGLLPTHASIGVWAPILLTVLRLVQGFALGGEQSGHVIVLDHATTGDGTLTGLMLAARVAATGRSLAELAGVMQRLPQVLINVPDVDKSRVNTSSELATAV